MPFCRFSKRFARIAALSAILMLAGCKQEAASPETTFEVSVVTVRPQRVPVTTELPGRTSAYLIAEVRARVNGIVLRRNFKEGGQVTKDQSLFKIDPAPWQAAVNRTKAALQKARANLASTSAQAQRFKVLVKTHAVSQQAYVDAVAAQKQAAADVATAKADNELAVIQLHYTDVRSPITGIIGTSDVTQGAYVQSDDATLMATVQQIDPIYVDLTQSTNDFMRLRSELANGQLQAVGPTEARVQLVLPNGKLYPQDGRLEFADITVNQSTGTVKWRAIFPNPKHVLLPGLFVRARLNEGINDHAMLVPEVGVSHNAQGQATALIVGAGNKVELRVLDTTGIQGKNWIVDSGLKPGDKVIVGGVQKVRPGMTVKVKTVADAGPATKPGTRH